MYERYELEVNGNQHFERCCQHIRNKLAQQIHEMRLLLDNRNIRDDSRLAANECLDELAGLLVLSFPVPDASPNQPEATGVQGQPNFDHLSKEVLSEA